MTSSDGEKRYRELMEMLFGAFQTEATEGMLNAYVLVVINYPYEVVQRAVLEIIEYDKWLPKASQIRQSVQNIMPRQRIQTTGNYRKRAIGIPGPTAAGYTEPKGQEKVAERALHEIAEEGCDTDALRSQFLKQLESIDG